MANPRTVGMGQEQSKYPTSHFVGFWELMIFPGLRGNWSVRRGKVSSKIQADVPLNRCLMNMTFGIRRTYGSGGGDDGGSTGLGETSAVTTAACVQPTAVTWATGYTVTNTSTAAAVITAEKTAEKAAAAVAVTATTVRWTEAGDAYLLRSTWTVGNRNRTRTRVTRLRRENAKSSGKTRRRQ